MVECEPHKLIVDGSIPSSATSINGDVTQLADVLVLETKSYRFKSYHPYHLTVAHAGAIGGSNPRRLNSVRHLPEPMLSPVKDIGNLKWCDETAT